MREVVLVYAHMAPRYDLETAQKGAGTSADPLIPQNEEQMRRFANQAARRVRSAQDINIEVDGDPGRVRDVYEEDGQTYALVKVFSPDEGIHYRVIELTHEMVGLEPEQFPSLMDELGWRVTPMEHIPSRLFHREQDPNRIPGQVLDVFVNPNDPLHLMTITKTRADAVGLALQKIMPGTDSSPMLAGRSIEVDVRPGVDWMDVDEPKGYLTGIIPTAVPKMAESKQELEINKEMWAKGGSVYSFHTPLSDMNTAEMNSAESAVANSSNQELNSGAEEHGIPATKRTKNLEGEATEDKLAANFTAEIDAAHEIANRAKAENAQLKAQMAITNFESQTGMTFDDLVAKMEEAAETPREKKAIEVMTKVNKHDDGVQDMILENPEEFDTVQADFSFMARAVHRESARVQMEQERARQQQLEADIARESRRQELVGQAQARRQQASYSFGSGLNLPSSSSSTTTQSSAPVPQQEPHGMNLPTQLTKYMLVRRDADFTTGGSAYARSSVRACAAVKRIEAAGFPVSVFMSWDKNYQTGSRPQSKRGREN